MPVRRDNPYPGFNFLVQVEGIDAAGFAEVDLGAGSIEVIEYREGADRVNTTRKLPGLAKFTNVVLKRGIAGDDTFFRWFEQIHQGQADRRTVDDRAPRRGPRARRDLAAAQRVAGEMGRAGLNAAANEVAIETLELVHEGLELE